MMSGRGAQVDGGQLLGRGERSRADALRRSRIVGVGSHKVTTTDELKSQVDKAGKTVALLIERQGRQIFVPVKIS